MWISTSKVHYVYDASGLDDLRNYLDDYYILMADIDLSSYTSWTPIGTYGTPFTGDFDGNNHTISNLTISSTEDYQGLLGYTDGATVRDTYLTVVSVSGGSYTVALIGWAISSVVSNCNATGTVSGTSIVGGLTGSNSGLVTNCYATGIVSGTSTGGLISYMYGSGTWSDSYYNSVNTGNSYGYATSLTEMQLQATFSGWDFTDTWGIGSLNNGYPCLIAIPPSILGRTVAENLAVCAWLLYNTMIILLIFFPLLLFS